MRITRGQRFRLDAYTANRELFVGCHLDAPLEIDICCFGLDANGKLSDDRYFVFYNQLSSPNGALQLEPVAANSLDNAQFHVLLDHLPPTVRRLVFTASIDEQTGKLGTMSQLRAGYLRLSDTSGELGRYEFSGDDFSTEGALMLGELYWKDSWRFWAVGQGFSGNLGALLTHFGGVAVEDNAVPNNATAPTPTNTTPPSQAATPPVSTPPSPPISAPTPLVSSSVTPPASTPNASQGLQGTLDATPEGGTLQLPRGEYAGPIIIRRALTILAPGAVVWAQSGPVVTIAAPNVILRDLEIEVTAPDASAPENDVALRVETQNVQSGAPQLENVFVRGRVVGVAAPSDWHLPATLELGDFAPRAVNTFSFSLNVPQACDLKCDIAGVSLQPPRVEAGTHAISVFVRDVPADTFLAGRLEVRADGLVRAISISGRAVQGAQAAQNRGL